MTKTEFVKLYAIKFSAARMAIEYQDHCDAGWTGERSVPPVEDALRLAEHAWDAFLDSDDNYFPYQAEVGPVMWKGAWWRGLRRYILAKAFLFCCRRSLKWKNRADWFDKRNA